MIEEKLHSEKFTDPRCHKIDAMNTPEPKLVCKRHRWTAGWICDNCGMRRADYEDLKKSRLPTNRKLVEIKKDRMEDDRK